LDKLFIPKISRYSLINQGFNWERIGKIYPSGMLFSQAIGENMFKVGPLANIEFATCLEGLSQCPDAF